MTAPIRAPVFRRRRLWIRLGLAALPFLGVLTAWTWWAEQHPNEERALRVLAQDQLETWLPGAMEPDSDGWHGLLHQSTDGSSPDPAILLVHGLDEPGSIWDDLLPALRADGYDTWELRYPNDQGIDRSADYLAAEWPRLPTSASFVLIGHSMGGLVIRDFVTRWRHPAHTRHTVGGAEIRGVILAGTPNHGSEWARLRIWLELREHLAPNRTRHFSLLAALRDGTGAAKIDLRPDSALLRGLNARPWPQGIPIRLIGGMLLDPTQRMTESLGTIAADTGSQVLEDAVSAWWSTLGDDLGDGVVTVASLRLPEAPPPVLVKASHRGMLTRGSALDTAPPAIPVILDVLQEWRGKGPSAAAERSGHARE